MDSNRQSTAASKQQTRSLLDFAIHAARCETHDNILGAMCNCVRALQPNAEFALYSANASAPYHLFAASAGIQEPLWVQQFLGAQNHEPHIFSLTERTRSEGFCESVPDLCIPVVSSGDLLAVLQIWAHQAKRTEQELVSLMYLANIAAENLRRITLLEEARLEARTDSLTGLSTLRQFREALNQHFLKSQASNSPLVLVSLDLDRFKGYNTKFGHPAGSRLLHDFGDLLRSATRQGEIAARVGGDEFELIWPYVGLDEALQRVNQIRYEMRFLPQLSANAAIGVSAGLADRGGSASVATFEELVDAALYLAKRKGRNRIAFAARDAQLQLFRPRHHGEYRARATAIQ